MTIDEEGSCERVEAILREALHGSVMEIRIGDPLATVEERMGPPDAWNETHDLLRYGAVEVTLDADSIVRIVFVEVPSGCHVRLIELLDAAQTHEPEDLASSTEIRVGCALIHYDPETLLVSSLSLMDSGQAAEPAPLPPRFSASETWLGLYQEAAAGSVLGIRIGDPVVDVMKLAAASELLIQPHHILYGPLEFQIDASRRVSDITIRVPADADFNVETLGGSLIVQDSTGSVQRARSGAADVFVRKATGKILTIELCS